MRILRLAGLALVLVCALALDFESGNQLTYSDERDYSALAQSLLHHGIFSYKGNKPIEDRPPGYPFVLAAVYAVVEQPLAAKVLNAVFLTLSTFLLGLLAGRLEPRARALVPYLVIAYPLLLYASGTLYPQTMAGLLLVAIVMLLTLETVRLRHCLCAGMLYGFLILAVPYFLALLPLFMLYLVIWGAGTWRRGVVLAAALALMSVALVLPWTVRNYLVFDTLVPVSANNGSNLFIGNSPATTANSGLNVPIMKLCNRLHPHMSDAELDAAFRQCALDWIASHPREAVRLYCAKLLNYFNFRNEIATAGQNVAWRDWLMFCTYYPLLLLSAARLALIRRQPLSRAEILIYLLYILNAFASAIFFTRLRFRIPLDFLLIAVVAAFVCQLLSRRQRPLSFAT